MDALSIRNLNTTNLIKHERKWFYSPLYFICSSHLLLNTYIFWHFFWCFTVSKTSKVNMEIIIHNYRRSIKYMGTMHECRSQSKRGKSIHSEAHIRFLKLSWFLFKSFSSRWRRQVLLLFIWSVCACKTPRGGETTRSPGS